MQIAGQLQLLLPKAGICKCSAWSCGVSGPTGTTVTLSRGSQGQASHFGSGISTSAPTRGTRVLKIFQTVSSENSNFGKLRSRIQNPSETPWRVPLPRRPHVKQVSPPLAFRTEVWGPSAAQPQALEIYPGLGGEVTQLAGPLSLPPHPHLLFLKSTPPPGRFRPGWSRPTEAAD